jgi:hypothetical protein
MKVCLAEHTLDTILSFCPWWRNSFLQPKREDGKQLKCQLNDSSPATHKHMNTTTTDIPAITNAPPVWLLAQGAVSEVLYTFKFALHHLDNEWHSNKWQTLHLSFFIISTSTANGVGRIPVSYSKGPRFKPWKPAVMTIDISDFLMVNFKIKPHIRLNLSFCIFCYLLTASSQK